MHGTMFNKRRNKFRAPNKTRPVRWTDTVRKLLGLPSPEIVEVGPGLVLTNLVKRIRGNGKV